MRLLIVGCGSIGRRHARNAAALTQVAVVDADPIRARDVASELESVFWFSDLSKALAWRPDGVVIATPSHLHMNLTIAALDSGAHVLVEKPISHQILGVADVLARADRAGRRVFVGCNMRYHPGPSALRAALPSIGRPLFARAHFGNYLPSMRPGVDYRTLYCARRESGGGVILDSIHEIDYIAWLLGPISGIKCTAGHISTLEIAVEDYAAVTMLHKSGARSEIHLDYFQRFKRRGCEIVGSDGTLIWSSEGKTPEHCVVRLYQEQSAEWEMLYKSQGVDSNSMYAAMLEEFLAVLAGRSATTLLDGWGGLNTLAAAQTALEASDSSEHRLVEWCYRNQK
jgi:predicted dehydrogenase